MGLKFKGFEAGSAELLQSSIESWAKGKEDKLIYVDLKMASDNYGNNGCTSGRSVIHAILVYKEEG